MDVNARDDCARLCRGQHRGARFVMHVLSACVALACCMILVFSSGVLSPDNAYADDSDQTELSTTSAPAGEEATDIDVAAPDADGAVVVEGTVLEESETQVDGEAVPLSSSAEEVQATEGETIEDEENPMSSGLETKSGPRGGVPLYGLVAVMLAAVVVFFVTSTRKVNANIATMNRKIR